MTDEELKAINRLRGPKHYQYWEGPDIHDDLKIVLAIVGRTMNNPPPDEGDVGKITNIIDDMAMLIRRLVRQVKKTDPSNPVAEAATGYLVRAGLHGSPLRNGGE